MTGGLSIWGLFYHRFWNRLGTFKIPSKGVKMHACSIWYTGEVQTTQFLFRYRHVYIYIYMSPGSDLTLSIVCGWLARAIGFMQTESESNGYIMNVSM